MNIMVFLFLLSLVSFAAFVWIISRKIPVLNSIKCREKHGMNWKKMIPGALTYNKGKGILKAEVYLQKVLSKIRILAMKLESLSTRWLGKLRTRAVKRKNGFSENYWKNVKESKIESEK